MAFLQDFLQLLKSSRFFKATKWTQERMENNLFYKEYLLLISFNNMKYTHTHTHIYLANWKYIYLFKYIFFQEEKWEMYIFKSISKSTSKIYISYPSFYQLFAPDLQ